MKKKNKKAKKNKKILIIICSIIILIVLALLIVFTIEDSKRISKEKSGETTTYIIKNTMFHQIKKDKVKIPTIKIEQEGGLIYLTTTLKNRTNKAIHGFDLEIEIYNKKGERITVLNFNNNDTIQPNGTIVLSGSATYSNDVNSLSYAKISFFEEK